MNRTNLFILLIFLIGLAACHVEDKKTSNVTKFPEKKEIKVTVIKTAPEILAPEEMIIMNDQIWVFQSKKERLFDVFELPDCKHIFSTGRKGQGPNDFIFPIGRTLQIHHTGFTILDANVLKFITPQPDGSLEVTHTVKTFDHLAVNGFIRLDDSLYCAFTGCATGSTSDCEYQMIDLARKKTIEFSSYPNLTTKEYEGDQRCQIYYKHLTAIQGKRKIAAFYSFFKFFRIYSYDGVLEQEVHVKIPPYQSDNVENWKKRMIFYGRPVSTEKYIYVPCMGNEIQVWDWEGNPVIQYTLDQTFITFDVCENTNRIFLISAKEDDHDKIFSFDLMH
ncbi:6-bladed beta-propeller [Proteiniphilum sp. X52]|uniref:6-bladed beta-propeller n=1 Tax=Proteiniphilum sp. X52 TaxID=2382159 RepID=UPI000F0A28F2|nr:6-bladed beta-propeller [Proteiniphilum sp. X52]RNC63255.1 hypothetical protein D7D25_17500 [Proteiniphilum sp. X52]